MPSIVPFYTDILLWYTWKLFIWKILSNIYCNIFWKIQCYWFHILKFNLIAPTYHFRSNCGFCTNLLFAIIFLILTSSITKHCTKLCIWLIVLIFLIMHIYGVCTFYCLCTNFFCFWVQNSMECLHVHKLCENKIFIVPFIIMIKVAI